MLQIVIIFFGAKYIRMIRRGRPGRLPEQLALLARQFASLPISMPKAPTT